MRCVADVACKESRPLMAIYDSSDQTLSFAAHIASNALASSRARPVMGKLANTYNLEGKGSRAVKLSRYDAPGDVTSIAFGTEYTGEAVMTSQAVTLTPTRRAIGATLDRDLYTSRAPGFSLQEILAAMNGLSEEKFDDAISRAKGLATVQKAFGPELQQLFSSVVTDWEDQLASCFTSLTASAGTSGNPFTVAVFDEALADMLGGTTLPHEDIVCVLDNEMLRDLRADLLSSSSSALLDAGMASIRAHSPDRDLTGVAGGLSGIPVYGLSIESRQTANAGADVVSGLFLRGYGDPEESGAGQVGTFALALGHMPVVSALVHPNSFGPRIVVDAPSAAACRVASWGCKIITDAP
jgi:hypothetical protein